MSREWEDLCIRPCSESWVGREWAIRVGGVGQNAPHGKFENGAFLGPFSNFRTAEIPYSGQKITCVRFERFGLFPSSPNRYGGNVQASKVSRIK